MAEVLFIFNSGEAFSDDLNVSCVASCCFAYTTKPVQGFKRSLCRREITKGYDSKLINEYRRPFSPIDPYKSSAPPATKFRSDIRLRLRFGMPVIKPFYVSQFPFITFTTAT